MEYRILGPLEVHSRGVPVPLARPRERRLLALLLLSANQPVALSQLVDGVWDGDPPASAKRQVQNCLSTLRLRLQAAGAPPGRLVAGEAGYRLHVGEGQLDAHRFHELVGEAKRLPPDDHAQRARLLRAALTLWRGPAFAGMAGRLIQAGAARLDEARLSACEECLAAELELGHREWLVGELTELVAANPLRERLVGQLMLALYGSARQAEALHVYQQLCARLADELGTDPGGDLQRLHLTILRQQTSLGGQDRSGRAGSADAAARSAASRQPSGAQGAGPPRQLPAASRPFIGRGHELPSLDRWLASDAGSGDAKIAAITGAAGVGKTALAVWWAHRVREWFDDGQLYVDLRGSGPEPPVSAQEVLVSLLRELGVEGGAIPPDLAARAAEFRTVTAGRRMLIVLDNACGSEQVRPLLPGGSSCVVLVTSRHRLSGLAAREGAHRIELGQMTVARKATGQVSVNTTIRPRRVGRSTGRGRRALP